MMDDNVLECVVGNRSFGKTVWQQLNALKYERVFFIDHTKKIATADFWLDGSNYKHSNLNLENKKFRIGFFNAMDIEPINYIAAEAIYHENIHFNLDEVAVPFKKGGLIPPHLKEIIFMGRHKNITATFGAQRFTSIPLDIRSQASRIITFRQTDPDDIKELKHVFPDDYLYIPKLKKLHYLDWNGEDVVERNLINQVHKLDKYRPLTKNSLYSINPINGLI